jgi:hypothetical protein
MVLRHEVLHRRRQKQRLIDLPGAERFAHAHRQNPTRTSLARKIRLLLGQAPSPRNTRSDVNHIRPYEGGKTGGVTPPPTLGHVPVSQCPSDNAQQFEGLPEFAWRSGTRNWDMLGHLVFRFRAAMIGPSANREMTNASAVAGPTLALDAGEHRGGVAGMLQ